MFEEEALLSEGLSLVSELKSCISQLNELISQKLHSHKIYLGNNDSYELVQNFDYPYSQFYYDDSDIDGNRVNTYLGYIFCDFDRVLIDLVSDINDLKCQISVFIKKVNTAFNKNAARIRRFILCLDSDGRLNLKELTRRIVLVDSRGFPVHRISFQIEFINKGKGRCLTAQEAIYFINQHLIESRPELERDVRLLGKLPHNELLSPVSSLRKKCRVNLRIGEETIKGKYASIPILILGEPSKLFKSNLPEVYDKKIKKVRCDQQLLDKPVCRFRNLTRKKIDYRIFLSEEELSLRKSFLDKISD